MKVPPTSVFLFRKAKLQQQIVEALELNDLQKVSLLKIQWAHRYGIETLPNIILSESSFDFEASFDETLLDPHEKNIEGVQENRQSMELKSSLEHFKIDNQNFSEASIQKNSNSRICDKSEELNSSLDINNALESSTNSIAFTPPPRPSLNHLRRWLIEDQDLPKAS